MCDYDLDHLLSSFWHINAKPLKIEKIQINTWIQQYIEAANPDFLIILDVSNFQDPIVFQKNYKIRMHENRVVDIFSIIDCIDPKSKEKIFKIDNRIIKFAAECYQRVRRISFRLKFKVEFIPHNPRVMLRDISVLSRDSDNKVNLVLISFFDITELQGKHFNLQIDVKKYDDEAPDEDFDKLKEDLKAIISPLKKITKREKEILELISEGKTSKQIANELTISLTTVHTHRQNIIRKNKVKNIYALLKSL